MRDGPKRDVFTLESDMYHGYLDAQLSSLDSKWRDHLSWRGSSWESAATVGLGRFCRDSIRSNRGHVELQYYNSLDIHSQGHV